MRGSGTGAITLREVASTDLYAYETVLDGYENVTVFMDTDTYPGPTPYLCSDSPQLVDVVPCNSNFDPTSTNLVRRTHPPKYPMTSLVTGNVDEVFCTVYDHFQDTLPSDACPSEMFDGHVPLPSPDSGAYEISYALDNVTDSYLIRSRSLSEESWYTDSDRRRLQFVIQLSDNMDVTEQMRKILAVLESQPSPPPPPSPDNCIGASHGQTVIQERVKISTGASPIRLPVAVATEFMFV